MTCEHTRQGDLPCATPACPAGFLGERLVSLERRQRVSSAAAFGAIYVGPDGMPVRGFPAHTKIIYDRRRSGESWELFEVERREIAEVTDEQASAHAWAEHERRAKGTDE